MSHPPSPTPSRPNRRLRTTLLLLTSAPLLTTALFVFWTRKSPVHPLPLGDALFRSEAYRKFNPNGNPATRDVCVRKVGVGEVREGLLPRRGKGKEGEEGEGEGEGRLVVAFCRGVWGGFGYAPQRLYLSRKYENPSTTHQLWSRLALQRSTYPVGTQITDHFEVVSHTADTIVVRCGDSPLKRPDVRESDGLFGMSAKVDWEEGVVVFELKSCFYKGLGVADRGPMPPHVEFAHRWYTKLWMEAAVRNCLK